MTILASSGKMPFHKLLFIAFENGCNKTLAAIFPNLSGIISKYFLWQVQLKIKYFFVYVPQELL